MDATAEGLKNEAYRHYQAGELQRAAQIAQRILRAEPRRTDVIYLLAAIAKDSGHEKIAVDGFALAVSIEPTNHVYTNALGEALRATGREEEALACFEKTTKLRPTYERAFNNMGLVFYARGDRDAAARCFTQAVQLNPRYATALNNLGGELMARKDFAGAVALFQRALAERPDYPEAHFNFGGALRSMGNPVEALGHLMEAVRLRPQYPKAHLLLGQVLMDCGQVAASVKSFETAVTQQPQTAEAHRELGSVLMLLGRLDEAMRCFSEALRLEPDNAHALVQRFRLNEVRCDWRSRDAELSRVLADLERELEKGGGLSLSPLFAMSLPVPRVTQRRIAERYADAIANSPKPGAALPPAPARGERIRIGYLSRDLYDHPVAHQMLGIFPRHDRTRFDVHVFSFGPKDKAGYREKVERSVEHFHDVEFVSIAQLARTIREQGIDILIDLMGYTGLARTACVAMRPAPIAVTWLGYAGTMGAGFVDYIIGDRIVTPPEHDDGYTEAVVRLPGSYMPTDCDQAIDDAPVRRGDEGLPENGIVFCCFNNTHKIDPMIFGAWMRILKRVEGGVAWLSVRERRAQENIRAAAQALGVAPERLVFSKHAESKAGHLARHRLADMFLDAHFYNAHATACDALWAGLPLIAFPGETYASRVGASLVTAAGLPELVMRDLDEYESTAVRLATSSNELRAVKAKLASCRESGALFDTARFVRGLERAYEAMWQTHVSGAKPSAIDVVPG